MDLQSWFTGLLALNGSCSVALSALPLEDVTSENLCLWLPCKALRTKQDVFTSHAGFCSSSAFLFFLVMASLVTCLQTQRATAVGWIKHTTPFSKPQPKFGGYLSFVLTREPSFCLQEEPQHGGDTVHRPSYLHLGPTPSEEADPSAAFPASFFTCVGRICFDQIPLLVLIVSVKSVFLAIYPFQGDYLVQEENELDELVYTGVQTVGISSSGIQRFHCPWIKFKQDDFLVVVQRVRIEPWENVTQCNQHAKEPKESIIYANLHYLDG